MATSQELWIEYDHLCDMAEAAAQLDPNANATFAPLLADARELACMAEHVEKFDKAMATGTDYPYVSADLADAYRERLK